MGSIVSFLSLLVKPLSEYLTHRKEIKLAKHNRDLAVIENQARLAQDSQKFNHAWEMASIQDKDKGLRYLSFVMFTSPVLVTVFSPSHGQELFARLDIVPEWIMQIWFYMIAGIWGIASLKDSVPQIIQGMRKQAQVIVQSNSSSVLDNPPNKITKGGSK